MIYTQSVVYDTLNCVFVQSSVNKGISKAIDRFSLHKPVVTRRIQNNNNNNNNFHACGFVLVGFKNINNNNIRLLK